MQELDSQLQRQDVLIRTMPLQSREQTEAIASARYAEREGDLWGPYPVKQCQCESEIANCKDKTCGAEQCHCRAVSRMKPLQVRDTLSKRATCGGPTPSNNATVPAPTTLEPRHAEQKRATASTIYVGEGEDAQKT